MRNLLILLGLAACGTDDNHVVLISPDFGGTGEGVDLATLSITGENDDTRTGADFCLGHAQVISLRAKHDAFCEKGRGFTSAADISGDPTACNWAPSVYLSPSYEHDVDDSFAAGDGYLVRGRDGVSLFRVRVVHDSLLDQTATATLEIEPVR